MHAVTRTNHCPLKKKLKERILFVTVLFNVGGGDKYMLVIDIEMYLK